MRILIVSSFFPYPLYSGGQARLFNLLRQLSKRHKITLLCPIRSEREKKYLPEIEKLCRKVILTYRGPQWSLRNIVLTVFSSQPFLFVGHRSEEMKRKIKEELEKEKYDLVQVESSYVMFNLPPTSLPVVLSEYNIEYLVYKRFADNFRFFFCKPFLYFDVWKMKRWEEELWRKAKVILTVSEKEKEWIEKRGIEKEKIEVIPNGVDLEFFRMDKSYKFYKSYKSNKKEKNVLFLGDFRWFPNRDAASWLIEKIWPEVKLKAQSSKLKADLIIAGRGSKRLREKVNNEDVRVIGEVGDVREVYKEADLLLAPMRIGGGTKFKILEAMASGVPVITTRIGIEGIKGRDGKEVLIRDNIEGLVEATIGLLENSDLRKKLRKNARKLIEERYSWEKIVRKLEEIYKLIKISCGRWKN